MIEYLHITSRLMITARELNLAGEPFDIIGIHEWAEIFRRIEANFVMKQNASQYNWWRDRLKHDKVVVEFPQHNSREYLHRIIDKGDKVWFVACDANSSSHPSKYWLFTGFVEPIQQIMGALQPFEYYIVSRKYDWLLAGEEECLIGLGNMKARLAALQLDNHH